MNYVGSLLTSIFMSVTYHYVLVFIDRLTKMRHLVLTAIMKVEEATQAFYAYVWKLHGLSESFVSDHDTQFTSENALMQSWNITFKPSLTTCKMIELNGFQVLSSWPTTRCQQPLSPHPF